MSATASATAVPTPGATTGVSGTLAVIQRGWRTSPELRDGALVTLLLALTGAAGRIAVPVLVQQALDRGIAGGTVDMGVIGGLGAVAAVAVLVAAAAQRTARVRLATRSEAALHALRLRAFAHLHRVSLADHAEERRGALTARVTSDIETLALFFAWGGMAWLVNGAVVCAVAATMAVYDWRLTLVVLGCSAPLVWVLARQQRRLVAAYAGVRERVADLLAALAEVVSGAEVVRAFGLQEATGRRVDDAVEARRRAELRGARLAAYLFPSGELTSVVVVAILIVVGVAIGPDGGLTAGALTGFLLLTYRFLEPVAEFTEVLDQTQLAVSGWRRVLDLLDVAEEIPDPGAHGTELAPGPLQVALRSVTFAYRPRAGEDGPAVPALLDVSFVVEPGRSVALVGATGSGKTTVARLLTRLADPTAGTVLVGGHDLRTVRTASLRRRVGMVPQEPFLFDGTVADNVALGAAARSGVPADRAAVRHAFDHLGLASWVDGLSDGLDTAVGERGANLSLGERQLVALARAHLADPACLVLDEATSAVDPATEARLARALERLANGRTTVTIAHRLSTAARADHVVVLHLGRVVEAGAPAALLHAGGPFARLHEAWVASTSDRPAPVDPTR